MHILVVEAEPLLRTFLVETLGDRADVASTGQAHAALAMLGHEPCGVVVAAADLGRGHPSGAWLLAQIGRRWPGVRRVIVGGSGADEGVIWLPKPFTVSAILEAIEGERATVVPAERSTVRASLASWPPTHTRNYGAGLRGLGVSFENRAG